MATAMMMFAIGLFGSGVCFFVAFVSWRETRAQRRWAPVDATVVEATLESRAGSIKVNRIARPTAYYSLRIRYRYFVDGREHESKNMGGLSFESNFHELMKRKLAEFQRRFPAGAVVPAYVNPKDPDDAVLTRGQPAWFIALFAAIGLVWTLGFGIYGARQLP